MTTAAGEQSTEPAIVRFGETMFGKTKGGGRSGFTDFTAPNPNRKIHNRQRAEAVLRILRILRQNRRGVRDTGVCGCASAPARCSTHLLMASRKIRKIRKHTYAVLRFQSYTPGGPGRKMRKIARQSVVEVTQ